MGLHLFVRNTALRKIPVSLPCLTCPHDSVCCSWGTDLIGDEAYRIASRFGSDTVVWNEDGPSTKVVNGRCVFQLSCGKCKLHSEPEYPAVCRDFPWRNAEDSSLPYPDDVSETCPACEENR